MLHYVDSCRHAEYVINKIISLEETFNYVIYPFGIRGKIVKSILNVIFNINEYMIVDNILSKKCSNIKSLEELSKENFDNIKVLICSDSNKYYDELRANLYNHVPENKCIDLFPKAVNYSNGPEYEKVIVQNIPFRLREMALKQTCEYIDKNMIDVPLFENRYLNI